MVSRAEAAGIYGFLNGLGYHGDPDVKDRLIQIVQRAASRGDWDKVIEMGLAYVFGSAVGFSARRGAQPRGEPSTWIVG